MDFDRPPDAYTLFAIGCATLLCLLTCVGCSGLIAWFLMPGQHIDLMI